MKTKRELETNSQKPRNSRRKQINRSTQHIIYPKQNYVLFSSSRLILITQLCNCALSQSSIMWLVPSWASFASHFFKKEEIHKPLNDTTLLGVWLLFIHSMVSRCSKTVSLSLSNDHRLTSLNSQLPIYQLVSHLPIDKAKERKNSILSSLILISDSFKSYV